MFTKRAFIRALATITCVLGTGLLCAVLNRSFEGLSPLGKLISPSQGLWRHHPTKPQDLERGLSQALKDSGLKPVRLSFDSREIPHLEADDDTSLYFAQGFVTAYYRLWQMDFVSRIAVGETAELLGEKALPLDRFFRRLRMPAAVRSSAELMQTDPITRGPLTAYTRGVNARIQRLGLDSIPVEYRIFNILPETWSEERSAALLKFMAWELTGYLYDFRMTATKAKLDQTVFEFLFPFEPKKPGSILGEIKKAVTQDPRSRRISLEALTETPILPEPANGSNNWAVPARLMKNRRALLANDLHLSYMLPSLWLPMQLTTPEMNVFGASLPGAPGIIVGFTESMGWAVTNGTDDVLDWYSLRFRDEKRQEYLFQDSKTLQESWRPVVARDEIIRVVGGKSETVRTRETHVGPIVFDEHDASAIREVPSGLTVQWIGFHPSNELRTFLMLNRSEHARDCISALRGYVSPAQNFLCADRLGKIVYRHAGVFPNRDGRDGRIVYEASSDSDLWQGLIPQEETPSLETSTELVVTANQAPFSGEGVRRYGWFFAAPFRANRIRERIEAKKSWAPEDMIDVQADQHGFLGEKFKATILANAASAGALRELLSRPRCEKSSGPTLREEIESWSGVYAASDVVAPLIQEWVTTFERATWTRLIGPSTDVYWPAVWRLAELFDEEASAYWDDPSTSELETLETRLAETYREACANLRLRAGSGSPRWSEYQKTFIEHTGRIPGLGRHVRNTGGVADAIFANKGNHGPTWKMIVSFEDHPRGWSMIPGGVSGDPASRRYDDQVQDWVEGKMHQIDFKMRDPKRRASSGGAK